MLRSFCVGVLALASVAALVGCQGLVKGVSSLTVNVAGAGTGTVTSTPNGIDCPSTCSATFTGNPQVTLTATPGTGFTFAGWSGACTGTSTTCTVSIAGSAVTATFSASLQSIQHIIFLAQENRSFDSYFGALRQYWAQNNFPDQQFDGLPQFNPPANPAAAPSNPGCNPLTSTATVCHVDPATNDVGPPVPSFHFNTVCVENPSPSWNESHADWNASDPVAPPPPTLDGFVRAAANDARQSNPPLHDVAGMRAMGYYDGGDLNYYYFMASNFATSDAWFAPVMTRTPPNREFLIGGTSHGYVYPIGANPNGSDNALISTPPIFEELQNAGISWKIYVNPGGTNCAETDSACLFKFTYVKNFSYGTTIKNTPSLLQNIVPISQFTADLQAGTLPQVAQIEPASNAGLDEHPSDTDNELFNVQKGANYVSGLINALMGSSSWSSSIFILTFDESGGFFDHVSPAPAVSPDGIAPVDLMVNDTCTTTTGPNCDFVFTGYRVPMIVISPYSKKNYVSHAANPSGHGADNTAILKLIETRFNLQSLTLRDADQLDMSQEFLDFTNAPWKVPPSNVPTQNTGGACYLDHLP
jgi:phospholipase C